LFSTTAAAFIADILPTLSRLSIVASIISQLAKKRRSSLTCVNAREKADPYCKVSGGPRCESKIFLRQSEGSSHCDNTPVSVAVIASGINNADFHPATTAPLD
jgi:hypothetical protein